MSGHTGSSSSQSLRQTVFLALAALGVVYGDIGTSPLYAIKEIFFGHAELAHTPANVLGVISLVFWSLTLVVTLKYVLFVLRADNEGEGGVFALFALLYKKKGVAVPILTTLLILAAGLLFGDGIITPAISVISAVEGLSVATTKFEPFIIPITIAILTGLFIVQRKGTAQIGRVFGPVISIWFIAIALIGASHIVQQPGILAAINPLYAAEFLVQHSVHTIFLILGSVMLVVTGGEAMYADMGHFGRKPIRMSWFALTYPALILNYFGQGAFLLSGHEVIGQNIFFSMVPSWGLYPMIGLATLATIIASQALITGAFSLITQAISLGLTPYLKVTHTHQEHEGQIYVGLVNWLLYGGCVWLVLTFKSSTNLASAYGLAVSGVMLVTTLTMIAVAQQVWKWPIWKSLAVFLPFVAIDGLFLAANSLKIFQGGYVPLIIGLLCLLIMQTWMWGRAHVKKAYLTKASKTMRELVALKKQSTSFLPRSIVFMNPEYVRTLDDKIPFLEQVFWDRYGEIPQHMVFLKVALQKKPHIPKAERFEIIKFYETAEKGSIFSVQVNFGFMEEPNVEEILEDLAAHKKIHIDEHPSNWQIHVVQERIYDGRIKNPFRKFQYRLFKTLLRNADSADHYFGLGKKVQLTIEAIPVEIY